MNDISMTCLQPVQGMSMACLHGMSTRHVHGHTGMSTNITQCRHRAIGMSMHTYIRHTVTGMSMHTYIRHTVTGMSMHTYIRHTVTGMSMHTYIRHTVTGMCMHTYIRMPVPCGWHVPAVPANSNFISVAENFFLWARHSRNCTAFLRSISYI